MSRLNDRDRLVRLRGEVGAMADLVIDRYEMAVDTLASGDPQTARAVIDGDSDLNDWYLDIETECLELMREQAPLAGELRCIAASFKIVTDLERIGDLSTNLAAYGRDADGTIDETVSLDTLVGTAGEMLTEAMESYTKQDADLAREVIETESALNADCRRASDEVLRSLVTAGRQPPPDQARSDLGWGSGVERRTDRVTRGLLTVRDLERIGDHAVNIAARTVYIVENDPEHIY